MSEKWSIKDVMVGTTFETTFWLNPVTDSSFRYRATHLDGSKAPKIILCNDPQVRPGVACMVRVTAIRKPNRSDRGAIEVQFVRFTDFKLEGVYLDPIVSRKLQILLESGLNILLDGPQGCGKTVLARSIAKLLGMEFVFFNCGAVVEASDFFATIQVRASESGQPVTEFVKTEVLEALEQAAEHPERSYLVFLDEFNRCQESARNALMPALDATRRVFHPIENRFISIPDNVQVIAAVNRGSEFSATFGIDPAQFDRFAPVQLDYMPAGEEVKLLRQRHPELGLRLVETIVHTATGSARASKWQRDYRSGRRKRRAFTSSIRCWRTTRFACLPRSSSRRFAAGSAAGGTTPARTQGRCGRSSRTRFRGKRSKRPMHSSSISSGEPSIECLIARSRNRARGLGPAPAALPGDSPPCGRGPDRAEIEGPLRRRGPGATDAHRGERDFSMFAGSTEPEFSAWISASIAATWPT